MKSLTNITVNRHVCKFKGCKVWPKNPKRELCAYHRNKIARTKVVSERQKNKKSPYGYIRYGQSMKDWIDDNKIEDYSERPISGETECTVPHYSRRSTQS
jgi:hypothetical protein